MIRPITLAVTLFSLGMLVLSQPGAAGAGTVPTADHGRIHAVLSPYDFYPASLPGNLQYVSWKQNQLIPMVCGTNVTIEFAGSGKRIDWSSSRACTSNGRVSCNSTGYPGYGFDIDATQNAMLNGRHVYFSMGNTGSNAWACIPLRTGNGADMAVVGIWENFMTPSQAMNLVAHAQR